METIVHSDLALQGALIMSKNEADFPANPTLGTMIIKDYCIYAYIRIGSMDTWYPFSRATRSYVHVQGAPSSAWIVNHQLGTADVWFQVTDSTGNIVFVGKTDINENSFQLDFTTATVGRCVVVAPDTISVPQLNATEINVANSSVIINNSGVLINGSYALTAASIEQQIADAIATKDNSDEITEGTTNLYFTNSRARAAISVTDNGGDGSLSYNNTTGVISYTGPSASEVQSHFTSGTGIQITSGQIAVDNTIATVSSLNAEITRASNAESTLSSSISTEISNRTTAVSTVTTNLNTEVSRAQAAEASIAASVAALGNAFNYVGTLTGGATSGVAVDMNLQPTGNKDPGDYYRVTTAGYFKIGTGGTPFFANLNDGLVWNTSGGIDIIDNTDPTVYGTVNEVSVTGSIDTGFTVALHSAFSGRMTSVETTINTEITRATNAETTIAANVLVEKTRALAAESSLSSAILAETSRAQAAEASLATAVIDCGTY